jgi:hypothetical protein
MEIGNKPVPLIKIHPLPDEKKVWEFLVKNRRDGRDIWRKEFLFTEKSRDPRPNNTVRGLRLFYFSFRFISSPICREQVAKIAIGTSCARTKNSHLL